MEKILPIHVQEIIFSSSDKSLSKQISKLVKNGEIKKIAPRIYTSNFTDEPEEIIKRNIKSIISQAEKEGLSKKDIIKLIGSE